MQGKIMKGIAGFYYVHVEEQGIYECKAKGIFRKEGVKPLVGDNVELDVLDATEMLGNIRRILPRKSALVRPAVANVDQALILFAIVKPNPNFNLLDRFLIRMERQGLPTVVCFNKEDIASPAEKEALRSAYETCGYQVLFLSVRENRGIDEVRKILAGKTTTLAGPSGVGKSSLINCLSPATHMETGEISEKIERGRHTTRHSEIIALGEGTYIMDTPGFTSLDISEITKEELGGYYPEFRRYEPSCKFRGCAHINEPSCGVKGAVEQGAISRVRYENYKVLYQELKEIRRY
ncbi:MAG: ribosome small subunit-dependent GTPase A [Bacteroidales bacterium]|nr:ribosome small subunit-dependent GTPase A [Bacteroidales bacterium]MCM1416613.1 ribosome small subunit-dependent GTPase A [bacterium]MCM1424324.1 ribosome small subunit-dependent GTPase A [bacterium]